jgi:hypothetical protein
MNSVVHQLKRGATVCKERSANCTTPIPNPKIVCRYGSCLVSHRSSTACETALTGQSVPVFTTFERSAGSGTRDAILPCISAKVKNVVPVTCLPDQDSSTALTTAAAEPFEKGQNRTKGRIRPNGASAPMSALQNRTCIVISIGRYESNFAIPLLTPLVR